MNKKDDKKDGGQYTQKEVGLYAFKLCKNTELWQNYSSMRR